MGENKQRSHDAVAAKEQGLSTRIGREKEDNHAFSKNSAFLRKNRLKSPYHVEVRSVCAYAFRYSPNTMAKNSACRLDGRITARETFTTLFKTITKNEIIGSSTVDTPHEGCRTAGEITRRRTPRDVSHPPPLEGKAMGCFPHVLLDMKNPRIGCHLDDFHTMPLSVKESRIKISSERGAKP